MKLRILLSSALLLTVAANALAQEKPPLPYVDQGACPFECCTYREWKAGKRVTAYVEPVKGAAKAFSIRKGQWVTAQTGFVRTSKAGVVKVLKPVTLGYALDDSNPDPALNLKPGEVLYTLHYLGEGHYLFWYQGSLYSDEVSGANPDPDPPPPGLKLQTLSVPVATWWVRVKTKGRRIGWIKDPPYFENSDACA